jgi:hypothetical protein
MPFAIRLRQRLDRVTVRVLLISHISAAGRQGMDYYHRRSTMRHEESADSRVLALLDSQDERIAEPVFIVLCRSEHRSRKTWRCAT